MVLNLFELINEHWFAFSFLLSGLGNFVHELNNLPILIILSKLVIIG